MESLVVVEVLDRRGRVRERQRVTELPFRIGRAYDNDLILDDPTVCPHHAVIDERDGEIGIADCGSVNGLTSAREPHTRLAIETDTQVRLGRSTLRLRTPGFVPPPAIAVAGKPGPLLRVLNHGSMLPGALLAALFTTYLGSVRESYARFTWTPFLTDLITALLVLLVWAGLWALLTRVLTPRGRFFAHLGITSIWLVGDTVIDLLSEYARFFFASIDGVSAGVAIAAWVLAAILFFGHLSLTGALSRWARRGLAAGLALVLVAVTQLESALVNVDWTYTLPYWSRLQPVSPAWLPAEDSATFFDEAFGLADALDELAEERLAEIAQ